MFTVPAAIRRVSGPPPVSAPIFTGPVVIPAQTVDTAFSWDMSQYFSGDAVVSYALTNDGGQAWLSINTSTGELSGTTPATPVTVSGVIVTATNTGGSTPTDAFGFEVEEATITTLFQDTFTDTNGTTLVNHTPDVDTVGDGWVAVAGDFHIQSNQAYCQAANSSYIVDVGTANMSFTVEGQTSDGGGSPGIVARQSNATNYLMGLIHCGEEKIKLYKKVAGGYQEFGNAAFPANQNIMYPMKFVCNGDDLTFTVQDPANGNTETELTATDSFNNTITTAGFWKSSVNHVETYDNMNVEGI